MKNKEYITAIVDLIDASEDLIEYDYQDKEDQIFLSGALVNKINALVQSVNNTKLDVNNVIKLAIREAFELSSSDVIISKNGFIFIKLIDESTIKEMSDSELQTVANRYNGFDEKELKEFYDEFFEDIKNEFFIPSIAEDFVDKYFIEEEISNSLYEKNVFSYIQLLILDSLGSQYDDNDDGFFKGFAGYIFRIHFKEVFENIADIILEEIASGNKYLIDFLGYYSAEVVVMNGYKYQVPVLESSSGLRWHVVTMLSIAKVYTETRASIDPLEDKIEDIQSKARELYINGASPIKYQSAIIKKRSTIGIDIKESSEKLNRYIASLGYRKEEIYRSRLKKEIQFLEVKIAKLRASDLKFSEKLLDTRIIKKYTKYQADLASMQKQLLSRKKILKQNKDSFESMKDSLAKALIQKKRLL